MNHQSLIQAYRQAPWRLQMQFIGLFCLGLVLMALVAGIYLNVTARAATIGRQIQGLQAEILSNQRFNSDLETQLALLTSHSEMEARAEDLGFRPADASEIVYLVVPGYPGRLPAVLAPPPGPVTASMASLPPEFTESLIDWIRQLSSSPIFSLPEVLP